MGKVCLSILNTWSGPKWPTIMHIGSILITLQSILTNNPLRNEPGYEGDNTTKNSIYNLIVEHDTIENLIIRNCFDIPSTYAMFTNEIINHMNKNKKDVISKNQDFMEK